MIYHAYVIRNHEVENALVFDGENREDVRSQLQRFIDDGAIAPFDEVVIDIPEDRYQSEGDYYVDNTFYHPRYCAVLNDDDYCTHIKKMPFGYQEGEEAENEIPLLSDHEMYVGAYFDGDRWDLDNKMVPPNTTATLTPEELEVATCLFEKLQTLGL